MLKMPAERTARASIRQQSVTVRTENEKTASRGCDWEETLAPLQWKCVCVRSVWKRGRLGAGRSGMELGPTGNKREKDKTSK